MRLAAKPGSAKLDWSVLDVEQEEWERLLAAHDAAMASGFAGSPAVAPTEVDSGSTAMTGVWNVRRVAPAVVILGTLAVLVSYGVWCTVQAGIARMRGDVVNAVKLEGLHARGEPWAMEQHTPVQVSVQEVEFLGNGAMATVLVTHTLDGDAVSEQELRFYVQTPKGWLRSKPLAAFWGRTETLDTAHLHFIFGSRDQAVVTDLAPSAEALYTMLRRATGVELAAAGRVPVEIVPGLDSSSSHFDGGRIRLASPSLYMGAVQERGELLGQLLRRALCEQLMAAVGQNMEVKTQWQPMVLMLGSWLKYSDTIAFAPDDEAAAQRRLQYSLQHVGWRLADLQGDVLRYDPATRSMQVFTLISDPGQQRQRNAAAEQLIDFIAAQYGVDILPALLQGFTQYENWDGLAPGVLGVSAAELQRAWHAEDVGRRRF